MKIDNYHPRQLLWPVSQIDVQRIMLCFLVEGHILSKNDSIRIHLESQLDIVVCRTVPEMREKLFSAYISQEC